MTKDDHAEDIETVISFRRETMINEDVKAAEQNMTSLINNIANQLEGDTGMEIWTIRVDRHSGKPFTVEVSLRVKK